MFDSKMISIRNPQSEISNRITPIFHQSAFRNPKSAIENLSSIIFLDRQNPTTNNK